MLRADSGFYSALCTCNANISAKICAYFGGIFWTVLKIPQIFAIYFVERKKSMSMTRVTVMIVVVVMEGNFTAVPKPQSQKSRSEKFL